METIRRLRELRLANPLKLGILQTGEEALPFDWRLHFKLYPLSPCRTMCARRTHSRTSRSLAKTRGERQERPMPTTAAGR
jgi:hypothetical protein